MIRQTTLQSISLAAALVFASACDPPNATWTEPRLTARAGSAASGAIINGYPPPADDLENLGIVLVETQRDATSYFQCTGNLVTNRHVLTARHCVVDSSTVVAFQTASGVQSFSVSAWEPGGGVFADTDFGLITLDHPAVIRGEANRLSHRVRQTVTSGMPVLCAGYGDTSTSGSGSGDPLLRWAPLRITNVLGMIEIQPNAQGQMAWNGDSGSACHFDTSPDGTWETSEITGAASFGLAWGGAAHYTPPWTTKPWLEVRVLANLSATYQLVPSDPTVVLEGQADAVDAHGTFLASDGAAGRLHLFAPRSTAVSVAATPKAGPAYVCPTLAADAPMSGELELQGVCLGAGLMAVLLGG